MTNEYHNEVEVNESKTQQQQQQQQQVSFFHESSTEEKGRHNLHEPLSFDSRSISRRVDSHNSNVSYLIGCPNDVENSKGGGVSYEIITIVFDKRHFNEASAQAWWTLNEIRIRKEIETK
jgi:hypothetical protein